MVNKEIIEELASLEHEQWCDWSKSIAEDLKKILEIADRASENGFTDEYDDNELIKQYERLERWEKLWTPYENLSEEIKESDRKYARKAYKIMRSEE